VKNLLQKTLEKQVLSQILETFPEWESVLVGTDRHIEEGGQCWGTGIRDTHFDTPGQELAGLWSYLGGGSHPLPLRSLHWDTDTHAGVGGLLSALVPGCDTQTSQRTQVESSQEY